ncbi:MAG: type 4a pilus biogenesis protein PilO [Candidatus Omnitrophota bacterium]
MKNIDFKDFDFQKYSKKIIAIAVTLIILLDFFLIMKPQVRWAKDLNRKNKELKTYIDLTLTNFEAIAQLQERLQGSKEGVEDIEKRVPSEEDIPLILEDISTASNDTMIKIFQMKPMRQKKEEMLKSALGQYYRIPISIDAKGSYHSFGKFLSTLENSEIFMSVDYLEINPSAKDLRRHNISLTINTFIFKKK